MDRKIYIAYGSNLNLPQMAIRCPGAAVIGKSALKDYELVFRGGRRGGGGYRGTQKRKFRACTLMGHQQKK